MCTNYFSHDARARSSAKLIRLRMKHGAEGYGVYWMIMERLREDRDFMSPRDYEMLAYEFDVEPEIVQSVVEDFGLFVLTQDGESFFNEELRDRMLAIEEQARARSEAGKQAIAKRWKKAKEEAPIDEVPSETPVEIIEEKTDKKLVKKSSDDTDAIGDLYDTYSSGIGDLYDENRVPIPNKINKNKINNKTKHGLVNCALAREAQGPKPRKKKEKILSKPENADEVVTYASDEEHQKMGATKSDALEFFAYNESRGWMSGQSEIKNWKSAFDCWILRKRRFEGENGAGGGGDDGGSQVKTGKPQAKRGTTIDLDLDAKLRAQSTQRAKEREEKYREMERNKADPKWVEALLIRSGLKSAGPVNTRYASC